MRQQKKAEPGRCAQPALNSLTQAEARAGQQAQFWLPPRSHTDAGAAAIRQKEKNRIKKERKKSGCRLAAEESESTSYANEFVVIAARVAAGVAVAVDGCERVVFAASATLCSALLDVGLNVDKRVAWKGVKMLTGC